VKVWKWEIEDTGENLQYTTTEVSDKGRPVCPTCGRETTYRYDQVDMTPMGDAVMGEWFSCHPCGIGTPIDYE